MMRDAKAALDAKDIGMSVHKVDIHLEGIPAKEIEGSRPYMMASDS